MKRLILTIILLLFLSPLVFGDVSDGGEFNVPSKVPVLTYLSDNRTGIYLTTYVSTTTVDPSTCKILGFAVYPITTNGEFVATLFDATSSAMLTYANFFGELETSDESFAGMWYPYPKKVTNGLCIVQGGQTRVAVYYTKY